MCFSLTKTSFTAPFPFSTAQSVSAQPPSPLPLPERSMTIDTPAAAAASTDARQAACCGWPMHGVSGAANMASAQEDSWMGEA